MPLLNELNLADNLMGSVPFVALGHVRTLRSLDLSNNRVQKVEDPYYKKERLRLDWLDLSENELQVLGQGAFQVRIKLNNRRRVIGSELNTMFLLQNFAAVNATSLRGNPLRRVDPGAFGYGDEPSSSSGAHLGLRRVDLSGCHLDRLEPESLRGLEKSLEILDLSANRLSELPRDLFEDFDLVRDLRLNDNMLELSPNITFNGFR